MLQQNDLDTKQLITDLTNLLTRGVDRIVGNNIKKREMLERKQQYVTETLTQLLLKLEEEESGFDDISAITSKTLENDNIEYNSNSNSSFNEVFLNNNDEAREQYLSNYVTYKELEESLLKDDTYAYSGKYLSVHGPNTRYLHETHESAWNDENRHVATFTGIIGNDNHETRYGKELLEKQIQSLVKDGSKDGLKNELKDELKDEQEVVKDGLKHEQEVVKEVSKDGLKDEQEVVKDVLQIQTDLNDVFEEEVDDGEEEEEVPIEEEEMIIEKVILNEEEKIVEEEEEELFEIQIGVTTYATDNEINGTIYALVDDGDVGDKVGYFKDGKAFFQ